MPQAQDAHAAALERIARLTLATGGIPREAGEALAHWLASGEWADVRDRDWLPYEETWYPLAQGVLWLRSRIAELEYEVAVLRKLNEETVVDTMDVSSREVGGGGREGKSQCSGTGAPVELRDGPGWDSAGCVPFAITPAASLDAAGALESLGRMARVPQEYPQIEQDEGNAYVADKLALVRSRLVVLEQERDEATALVRELHEALWNYDGEVSDEMATAASDALRFLGDTFRAVSVADIPQEDTP